MPISLRACALTLLCCLAAPVWAQNSQNADYIVALVNSEPITHAELNAEVRRVQRAMEQNGQKAPDAAAMRPQVLEGLISERAQLQWAREIGLRIDDNALDRAEQSVAMQNGVDVATMYQRLLAEGIDRSTFRAKLRDQQLLQQLRAREVESRVRVSDADIDDYLRQQRGQQTDPLVQSINLAQLLIGIPEKASAQQVATLNATAKKLFERARSGEDFAALVQQYSDAERREGGAMGLRRGDRYPDVFLNATKDLPVGGISEVVRTGAGFHLLKVLERQAPQELTRTVVQTRARHILLRTGPQMSQSAALERLKTVRQRILSGATNFAAAAREMSQDGSADSGGDLGWANPGMFVPEFEEVMNRIDELEISAPLVSRFGVHLIQVMERRRIDLDPQQVREAARMELREQRADKVLQTWAQDVRNRAFVEVREPPL